MFQGLNDDEQHPMRIKSRERIREISEEKKAREFKQKNRGKSSESILKSANEMITIVN